MSAPTLKESRAALLNDPSLRGLEFCRTFSKCADEWLRSIAASAAGDRPRHVALLAVGGYGRGELSPYSDLDLLLVHDGHRRIAKLADQLWYPVWDDGVGLDHSVRRPKEVLAVADEDLRVALGLLDARLVWGDCEVAEPLIERVRSLWSTTWADRWLPELESQMAIRHEQHGDVADLLEPDLKEAHGGLRDVNALTAVRCAFPEIDHSVDFTEVLAARDSLLRARVALHAVAGRELDRLLLQEQDQVAARAGWRDADELMSVVSASARVVARVSDTAWRRRAHWRSSSERPPVAPVPIEDGVEEYDGEIRLGATAPVSTDATLPLRLAAVASERDLPIALESLTKVRDLAPAPPTPWPTQVLAAFVRLLSRGPALISIMESLDAEGILERYLPEWVAVRSFHQRNAYHRFTVDRHLLEAVMNARAAITEVHRPDLLLIGVLLHDIGKGRSRDHTELGIELAQTIGPRIGLRDDDTATIVQMVRHHLLLADVATRRDLDDPATIRYVAAAVGDEQTLELLAALSRADGLATGPSAWGQWKSSLVDDLVHRVRRILQGHDHLVVDRDLSHLVAGREFAEAVVRRDDEWIEVVVNDRPGLLAAVTAALSSLALDIRSADLATIDGVAVDRFFCVPGPRGWPADSDVAQAIDRALADPVAAQRRLAERAASYGTRRRSAHAVSATAHALPAASDLASVIEVIARDALGLLSRIASAVAATGLDITAARLSTVGDVAIDTFYVRSPRGGPLSSDELDALLASIRAVIVTNDVTVST